VVAKLPEIPGYRVERLLGTGGMAAVYLATQVNLKRRVALKVMSNVLSLDERFRQRFLNEAQIIARFSHPNVIGIFDSGDVDGVLYMVTEYMDGATLQDRIGVDGMHPADSIHIIDKLAEVLEMAHGERVFHRDIKPENVLFDRRGRFVLADFGIAKAGRGDGKALTGTGNIVGTPSYMSPEQFRGIEADGRSDIYALGVMLYQMLTGQLPFTAPEMVALALKHASEPPPRLPPALRGYQALLDRMLAKEPTERFQDCGELRVAIRQVGTAEGAAPGLYRAVPGMATTDALARTAVGEAPALELLLGRASNSSGTPTRVAPAPGVPARPQDGPATGAPGAGGAATRTRRIAAGATIAALALAMALVWALNRGQPGDDAVARDPGPATDTPPAAADAPDAARASLPAWAASGDREVERELGQRLQTGRLGEWQSALDALASADPTPHPALRHAKLRDALKGNGLDLSRDGAVSLAAGSPGARTRDALVDSARRYADAGARGRPAPAGENAVDAWRMVLALEPGNAAAAKALRDLVADYVSAAQAAIARGNLSAASRPIANGLALDPENEELLKLRDTR
jgi:serine/threonine-protein kinase PpkA